MKRFGRATRAIAATASLLALGACGEGEGRSLPAPSGVIVVDVDTLRADGLSCYGNPRRTSPHIDELARIGTRFEWAFAQAPYTLPSQVSILTSLYPWSHRVIREKERLSDDATTAAEIFRAAGWKTAAFTDGGFVSEPFGFAQGFDHFVDGDRGGLARSGPQIEAWLRALRPGEPFFLFVHTYDPHTPYAPPEDLRATFTAGLAPDTPGFEPTTEALEAIRASQWAPPRRQLSPGDLAWARALYDGEVAGVDRWIGRLLGTLEQTGLRSQVAIALISDHGEEFQEHGSLLHEKLYSSVLRVPFILSGAGVPAGVVVDELVEAVDLLPTLLELAGVAAPPTLQGRSLLAAGGVKAAQGPRVGLAHSPFWDEQRAIFDAEFHLIVTLKSGARELFRYRTDVAEQENLSESNREQTGRLVAALRRRAEELERTALTPRSVEASAEIEESLRALGYLR